MYSIVRIQMFFFTFLQDFFLGDTTDINRPSRYMTFINRYKL